MTMTYTSTGFLNASTGGIVANPIPQTWDTPATWADMTKWAANFENPMIYYTEPVDLGSTKYFNLKIEAEANGEIQYNVLTANTASFTTTYDRAYLETTVAGTTSLSTSTKKYGTASISFPGTTSSYITVDDSLNTFSTSTFTFEAWVYITKPESSADRMVYYSKRDDSTHGIELYSVGLGSGWNVAVRVNDGSAGAGSWTLALGPVTTSTWHHVAFSIDGAKCYRGFVDGHCYGAITGTQNLILSTTTAYIGGVAGGKITGGLSYFQGYMDDIRISNSCLYAGAFDTDVFTPPASALTSTTLTRYLNTAELGIVDHPNILESVTETLISNGDTNIDAFYGRYVSVGIKVTSSDRPEIKTSTIIPTTRRFDILLNDVNLTTLTNSTTTSTSKVLDLGRETSKILAVFPQKTSGLDDVGIVPIVANKTEPAIAFVKATEGAQDYVYGGTAGAAVDPSTLTSPIVDVVVHVLPEQYMEDGVLQVR